LVGWVLHYLVLEVLSMPLFKTLSGVDKQIIVPRKWTAVKFADRSVVRLAEQGWSIYGVMLRVEYPVVGCPSTLRGRLVRFPDSDKEDWTGFDDKNPLAGQKRHHSWHHFLLNQKDLTVSFMVWHDGSRPVVLDGRQFKWTRFK
jgi:hypothetical protein